MLSRSVFKISKTIDGIVLLKRWGKNFPHCLSSHELVANSGLSGLNPFHSHQNSMRYGTPSAYSSKLQNVDRMMEWLKREGGIISGVGVSVDRHGQLQLVATENLWKGKLLISLPVHVLVKPDKTPVPVSEKNHECLERILNRLPDDRCDYSLAVKLLASKSEVGEEEGGGEGEGGEGGCFHSPYVQTLPEQFLLPSFFSPNAIAETQSKEIYDLFSEEKVSTGAILTPIKNILQNCPAISNTFRSNFESFQKFSWALAAVKSRSLQFDGGGPPYLTPLVDLANHNFDPNTVAVNLPNGRVGLMTCKDVYCNDPLEISYMHNTSTVFFWLYGFTPTFNECDSFQIGPLDWNEIVRIADYGKFSHDGDVIIMSEDKKEDKKKKDGDGDEDDSFVSMAEIKRECLSRLGLNGDSDSNENGIYLEIDSQGKVEGSLLASLRVLLAQTSINELKKVKKQVLSSWRTPPPFGHQNEIKMIQALIDYFLNELCDEVGLLSDKKTLKRDDVPDAMRLAIEYRMVERSIMSNALNFLKTKMEEVIRASNYISSSSSPLGKVLLLSPHRKKTYANKVKKTKK